MHTALKRLGKSLFSVFGLEIRINRERRATLKGALHQLSTLGFHPQSVIDVGVASETPDLYEAFPEARILLIEPLADFKPFLQRICHKYKAEYILSAAGDTPGTATLNVHPDRVGSSFFKEVEGPLVDGMPLQVSVITIDQACVERSFQGPYLIKVDVQGAELQVLAGARRTLLETEAVVLEVTLFGTMIGGPQLCDVVAQMKAYGFVVYDIFGFNYRPFDGALAQIDMIFVREQGRFRQTHVFSTPEKRREQFADAQAQFVAQGSKVR